MNGFCCFSFRRGESETLPAVSRVPKRFQVINPVLMFCDAVCTVLGLEEGKECIIVGTIYKHMKLKPSILDEYSKEVLWMTFSRVFMSIVSFSLTLA